MKSLFEICLNGPHIKNLTSESQRFKEYIESRFGLNFEINDIEDNDEDNPTFVSEDELLSLNITKEDLKKILES